MSDKPKNPRNKVQLNHRVEPQTDYELRELGRLWNMPLAQVVEHCIHVAKLYVGDADLLLKAKIRQAEAKLEMLKNQ